MMNFQSLLKNIATSYMQKLPFAVYRKPNENTIKAIVQKDDSLVFTDDYTTKGFVFAPFDSNEKTILFPLHNATCTEVKFEEKSFPLRAISPQPKNTSDKIKHLNLVDKAIVFIKNSETKKVVVSRREEIELPNFSFIETFERLLQTYKSAFVYVWYHPKVGLWLGATPEKMIALKGKNFSTVSLAGTQIYRGSLDVKWGTKELQEQQIVTDYIQSNLEVAADVISISKLNTIKAGNLLHLSTNIKGTLQNENDLYLVVSKLHPTPAVCGFPKHLAKQFILNSENYKREFYTGFLGEINMEGITSLFVNLRCMKVENSTITLFLGGGITKDSNAENEWQETVEKSKILKKVLLN